MRIAVGQLSQETNTFNPLPTTRQDFEDFGIFRGADVIARMAQTNELGGFIQTLRAWPGRPEIVGLVRLSAWPSGPVRARPSTGSATNCSILCTERGRWMACCWRCTARWWPMAYPTFRRHLGGGARHIGPRVPLVVTLDLHANITAEIVKTADVLVTYHTAPHIDVFETGQRGAAVLRRIAIDGARPVTAFQKIPMVVPPERPTRKTRPASAIISANSCARSRPSRPAGRRSGNGAALAGRSRTGQCRRGGHGRRCRTGDAVVCRTRCPDVGRRCEYLPDLVPVEVAVREAFERQREGLIVLSDSADSTNSGAPGDSTCVLRELVKLPWSRGALATMVAPEIVADAERLGVGAERTGPVGGLAIICSRNLFQ